MKRTPIAAGNWKLNNTIAQTTQYFKDLLIHKHTIRDCEVIIAPVALSLPAAAEAVKGSYLQLSAQNCYHKNSGAFTGELSPALIKDAGAYYSLVGHSERRTYFKENDKDFSLKNKALIDEGLTPIFCIGETLEQREAGKVENVLESQLTYGLEGVDVNSRNFIIAYEPVWAIGTGRVASKIDAQNAHAFVRNVIEKLYGNEIAQSVRILYGGSVTAENVEELIAQNDIDGALVGGASLTPAKFIPIINAIEVSGKGQ